MSERWKPACKDVYWLVDFGYSNSVRSMKWDDDDIDTRTYSSGNCFKTEEEAKVAAEKVKALLLSLHEPVTECNQMNRLTEDMFLLHTCPEWAKYVAIDSDGEARYHELKPEVADYWWVSSGNIRSVNYGKFDVSDWQNSRIERPVKVLPKLTTEVFNREDCPKWAKYAAVDEIGIAFYYRDIPRKACETWRVDSVLYYQEISGEWDASDWKHSLIERPVKELKLPDWCKVGEWCYCLDDDGNPKYFKITTIKDNYIYGEDWDIDYHFVKQAHPRPYNAKEMRGLIGKAVGDEHGNLFFVTAFVVDDGGAVCVNGVVYNANDLLEVFTIDNEPCGVLEHLNENGEWVE